MGDIIEDQDSSRTWKSIIQRLNLAGRYFGLRPSRFKAEMHLTLLRNCFMDSIKAECYKLVQIVVLKLNPFCKICRKPSEVGHHIWKRDRLGTAFNPDAVVALCNACHAFAHSKPYLFKQKAREWLGVDYEKLETLSRTIVQLRDEDYKQIKKLLKEAL